MAEERHPTVWLDRSTNDLGGPGVRLEEARVGGAAFTSVDVERPARRFSDRNLGREDLGLDARPIHCLLCEEGEKRPEVKGGGVILIGPIPIIFGSDARWASIAIVLAIVLIVIVVLSGVLVGL